MPSVPFGLCIWSSYKLNSKERWSCIANHCWLVLIFLLRKRSIYWSCKEAPLLRGSSLVIGWQRWSRPSRTSVNPDPLTMVATPGEHGSDAKKVHFHEIHLVLMYRVSWWIPFGYLFTLCGVLCFLVFTVMHRWLRKQWWVGASIWSRVPNTKRWHTRPTRVAHTQVCFVHRETI